MARPACCSLSKDRRRPPRFRGNSAISGREARRRPSVRPTDAPPPDSGIDPAARRLAEVKTLREYLDDLTALACPRTGEALSREIRARVANWAVLVGQEPAVARQIRRKLLVGRLRLTPKITEGGRWYEFSGKASYGALLSGSVVSMVPPERLARLAQQPIEVLIAA